MGACAVPHRCPPAVFGTGGRGRLHWGSSCCVSEVSSHLGNGSSQASGKGRSTMACCQQRGKGRSAMACCQQRALDLVFRRGFLSCRHRPTRLSAFHVVHAPFICGRAGDGHVGRHGCNPAAFPRLRSRLGQPGEHVHACTCFSLAGLSALLGHQRARGRWREPGAPAKPWVPTPGRGCSCPSWGSGGCKRLSRPIQAVTALQHTVGSADLRGGQWG